MADDRHGKGSPLTNGSGADHGHGVHGAFNRLLEEDEGKAKAIAKAAQVVLKAVMAQRLEGIARQVWRERLDGARNGDGEHADEQSRKTVRERIREFERKGQEQEQGGNR